MKIIILILLTGCASKMKKEFWQDVGYKCPPQECVEGEANSYDKAGMKCKCIPVSEPR